MRVVTYAKYFLMLFAIFGSGIESGLPITLLRVQGSLLELRDGRDQHGKGGGHQAHENKKLLQRRSWKENLDDDRQQNLKNISYQADFNLEDLQEEDYNNKNNYRVTFVPSPFVGLSTLGRVERGGERTDLLVPPQPPPPSLEEQNNLGEVMELSTVSVYGINFFDGKESHIPASTFQADEESGPANDSTEEIFLSPQNKTDMLFGWTELGLADLGLVTLFCSIIAGTVVRTRRSYHTFFYL